MLKEKLLRWAEQYEQVELDRNSLTWKLRIGLLLIALSFVIGWGVPALALIIGAWAGAMKVALITGAVAYAFSWLVWGAGMLLTGKANYDYGKYFLAKFLLRKWKPPRQIDAE